MKLPEHSDFLRTGMGFRSRVHNHADVGSSLLQATQSYLPNVESHSEDNVVTVTS